MQVFVYTVNVMESHDSNETDSFQQLFIVDATRFSRFAQALDVRADNPRLRTLLSLRDPWAAVYGRDDLDGSSEPTVGE